ncbi:type II toxin-antitoxin system RelE/ParE family toxin [Mucilaginibacter sp. SJ]|uniref:type II toxin-antitoxin system RelE/ParE family toxin n=1 Tax=Mucilaginibacter sp. SJ TaxID=3029053 RepID=UPI0023A9CAF3|nr:type II toxin-antitoxin system RelE/ParE family toxin [Mucilaginibacter sp. SJ]WEA03108.1 type II toxin-antitoxin system RelE/ParE family toxin [Mucilaginibacter sp. SJ]
MDEFEIFWSSEARKTFVEIIEYLDYNWTIKEVNDFISRTDSVLIKIRKNPFLFQQRKNDPSIRQAVLHPNVSLLYRITDDQKVIFLLTFWDNRQDPERLKLE